MLSDLAPDWDVASFPKKAGTDNHIGLASEDGSDQVGDLGWFVLGVAVEARAGLRMHDVPEVESKCGDSELFEVHWYPI